MEKKYFIKKNSLWGKNWTLYNAIQRSWDIDTETDFKIVSFFMENNK